jgi:hypothetical protein
LYDLPATAGASIYRKRDRQPDGEKVVGFVKQWKGSFKKGEPRAGGFIKALKSDFDEIAEREYTIIEPVEVKPGVFRLYQLLNPGFDSKIKVYCQSTGIFRDPDDFRGGVDLDGFEVTTPHLAVMGIYKVGRGFVRVTEDKYKKPTTTAADS